MTRIPRLTTAVALCLLGVPFGAAAQAPTTIDQLVAIALERSPQLRAARAAVPMAMGERTQAALRPSPSAVVEERRMSDLQHDLYVGMEWPLDLFRRTARVQTADAVLGATRLTVEDQERLLAGEVRRAAGRWLAARRSIRVLTERLDAARRMRELLDARVNEGDAPKVEANIAAVEVGRMQVELTLATAEADADAIGLRALVGLPPDAPLALSETIESLVVPPAATPPADAVATAANQVAAGQPAGAPPAMGEMPNTQGMALEHRADLREASARIAVVDARIAEARRNGRFDVSLQGGYSHARLGFPVSGFDARGALVPVEGHIDTVLLGARTSLPFWNRNQGTIQALTAEKAGATDTLAARQRQARAEFDVATLQDREARKALEQYAAIRDVARQNVDVLLEAYDLGRTTLVDLLTEQRRYLDVETGYTEVLARAYDATVALRLARGEAR
jgi:cobalt-zinc-cadmium efflux system outer membrane protein